MTTMLSRKACVYRIPDEGQVNVFIAPQYQRTVATVRAYASWSYEVTTLAARYAFRGGDVASRTAYVFWNAQRGWYVNTPWDHQNYRSGGLDQAVREAIALTGKAGAAEGLW